MFIIYDVSNRVHIYSLLTRYYVFFFSSYNIILIPNGPKNTSTKTKSFFFYNTTGGEVLFAG